MTRRTPIQQAALAAAGYDEHRAAWDALVSQGADDSEILLAIRTHGHFGYFHAGGKACELLMWRGEVTLRYGDNPLVRGVDLAAHVRRAISIPKRHETHQREIFPAAGRLPDLKGK